VPPAEQRARRSLASVVAALGALAATAAPAAALEGETELISRASGVAGAKQNDDAFISSISRDGRSVGFSSGATNLDPADGDGLYDVYVRDRITNATTLVSRAPGVAGAKGNGDSFSFSASADGRKVVFESESTNLDPDDTDALTDVYVRDLNANTTTLVSRADGAEGAKSNGQSIFASISDDGRYVAFSSQATNLDPDDPDTNFDVYVRDLATNTIVLASRASGPAGAKANAAMTSSAYGGISADGRYVGLGGSATNLDPADLDEDNDAYVRDLAIDTTTLVSRASAPAGAKANGDTYGPEFSTDGGSLVFQSFGTNLDPADTDLTRDLFLRDLVGESTRLVSRASGVDGEKGNRNSVAAAAADQGRYVAFSSESTNLDPDDTDILRDIFVRDMVQSTTTLVSRASGADGAKGNGEAENDLVIVADGRFVGFESAASNLSPDDADTDFDVYVRDVLGAPELLLSGKRKQRSARRVRAGAICANVACELVASGKVKLPRPGRRPRRLKLRPLALELEAGTAAAFELRPSKHARKAIKRTLSDGAVARVQLAATATDAFGDGATAKRKLKLKRRR
jgi:hypothetical protein